MKPRLEALPLTDSDEGIWADVIDRTARDTALGNGLSNMFCVSEDADRRDAELMLQAMKPASSPWCLGCIAGPFCCEQGKPWQCRLRVNGALRDITW